MFPCSKVFFQLIACLLQLCRVFLLVIGAVLNHFRCSLTNLLATQKLLLDSVLSSSMAFSCSFCIIRDIAWGDVGSRRAHVCQGLTRTIHVCPRKEASFRVRLTGHRNVFTYNKAAVLISSSNNCFHFLVLQQEHVTPLPSTGKSHQVTHHWEEQMKHQCQ